MQGKWRSLVIGAVAVGVAAGTAMAGGTPQQKCIGSKLKAAGKAVSSELGCDAKAKAKSIPTDPNCISKAVAKLNAAITKAGGICGGTTTTIDNEVAACRSNLLPDTPGNGKCQSSSTKAVGKGAGSELSCQSKEVTKPGSFAACDAKEDGKTSGALTKAGACGQATFAVIDGHIDNCNTSISNDVNPPTTTTTSTSTTTTSTSTSSTSTSILVTTTSTSTTSTSTTLCNCCSKTVMSFTTGNGSSTATGELLDDSGAHIIDLTAGGLYFGGGLEGVPLPAVVPASGVTQTSITACNSITGAFTIAARTSAQTGSNANCSDLNCLFGPPLPIPNPSAPSTSTCVINVVSAPASGSGNCNGSVTSLNLPLASGIYLTGDLDGVTPGIQACPVCLSNICHGGPNNGLACTPGTTTTGDAFPTSNDCPPPVGNFLGNLPIAFDLSTGLRTKTAFDNLPTQTNIFCGYCASNAGVFKNPAQTCTTNATCVTGIFTKCRQKDAGAFSTDLNALNTARTINETGTPSSCLADGAGHSATLVSVFCTAPTFNGIVDGSADLPGPGAVALPGTTQLLP